MADEVGLTARLEPTVDDKTLDRETGRVEQRFEQVSEITPSLNVGRLKKQFMRAIPGGRVIERYLDFGGGGGGPPVGGAGGGSTTGSALETGIQKEQLDALDEIKEKLDQLGFESAKGGDGGGGGGGLISKIGTSIGISAIASKLGIGGGGSWNLAKSLGSKGKGLLSLGSKGKGLLGRLGGTRGGIMAMATQSGSSLRAGRDPKENVGPIMSMIAGNTGVKFSDLPSYKMQESLNEEGGEFRNLSEKERRERRGPMANALADMGKGEFKLTMPDSFQDLRLKPPEKYNIPRVKPPRDIPKIDFKMPSYMDDLYGGSPENKPRGTTAGKPNANLAEALGVNTGGGGEQLFGDISLDGTFDINVDRLVSDLADTLSKEVEDYVDRQIEDIKSDITSAGGVF